MIQPCVLSMFYTQNGVKHCERQGKVFPVGTQWYYLVNVNKTKFIRKYKGYAIAQRILEAFHAQGLKRVTIIFKNKDTHVCYTTNSSMVKDQGNYDNFGSHRQVVLPLKYCSSMQGYSVADPKNLPVVDVNDWAKGIREIVEFVDNRAIITRIEPGKQMGLSL